MSNQYMSNQSMSNNKHQLRQTLRARRNAMNTQEQQSAAFNLAKQLECLPELQAATTIAAYLANDGEIDPQAFLKTCWDQHKIVCLPILHPFCKGHLIFQRYHPKTPMTVNRYGISEPVLDCSQIIPVQHIELVLAPLVGFDTSGHRMGMGGGFYDRTFAHQHPPLIGLAHDCQEVPNLNVDSWDIPMQKIITPTRSFHGKAIDTKTD